MKKRIICLLLVVLFISGCSDEEYSKRYADPSTVGYVTVPKLFTGMMIWTRDHLFASYFRYFGIDTQFYGRYAQIIGNFNDQQGSMYEPGYAAYVELNFYYFYRAARYLKKIDDHYQTLSDDDKASEEVYLMAAKVIIYDYLVACLDVYGDMPWEEAAKVVLTGDVTDAHAKYDKAEDVYKLLLDDLKPVAARFAESAGMVKHSAFAAQDYINDGDFNKWHRWANSLRLRIALRVASNGPLTSVGQAVIKEILENSTSQPIVETNDQNIGVRWRDATFYIVQGPGHGLGDWGSCRWASSAMVKRLQNDWRLNLLYTLARDSVAKPNEDPSIYRGTDFTVDNATHLNWQNNMGISWVRRHGFLFYNENYKAQMFSAAESWFIKAEAYQKGWASGDAEAAFKRAILESITFYFDCHDNRKPMGVDNTGQYLFVIDPVRPTVAEIEAFANDKWNSAEYVNKEDAIITQKWINFGIMFTREAWNEIRRTGYPSGLVYPQLPATARIRNVPNRWKYPVSEVNYNRYYEEVAAKDTYEAKLFWAK